MARIEKEEGVAWECHKCETMYNVRTPFHSLHCPECLARLDRDERLLPVDKRLLGYWILEDY